MSSIDNAPLNRIYAPRIHCGRFITKCSMNYKHCVVNIIPVGGMANLSTEERCGGGGYGDCKGTREVGTGTAKAWGRWVWEHVHNCFPLYMLKVTTLI